MAVVCPACNTENRDGARFCKGCGGKLATALGLSGAGAAPPPEWPATAPAPLSPAAPVAPGVFDPSAAAADAEQPTVIVATARRSSAPLPDLLAPAEAVLPDPDVPSAPAPAPSRSPPPFSAALPSEPAPTSGRWLVVLGAVAVLAAAAGGWYAYSTRSAPAPTPVVATPPPAAPPAVVAAPPSAPVEPAVPAAPAVEPQMPVVSEPVAPLTTAEPPRAAAAPAAAAPKPRKVAPVAAAPVPAAAPAVPVAPVAATEPPPPPAAPQTACAGRNFIATAQCMASQCVKPEFRNHAQCEAVRKQQRLEDERRNLY